MMSHSQQPNSVDRQFLKLSPYRLASTASSETVTGRDMSNVNQDDENTHGSGLRQGLVEGLNTQLGPFGDNDPGKSHMPEMESPGRNSEMSSSMCSTPGTGHNTLPYPLTSKSPHSWQPLFTANTSPPIQYDVLPSGNYDAAPATRSNFATHQDLAGAVFARQVDQDCIMDAVPMFAGDIIDLHDQEDSLSNISNSLQTSENEEGEIGPSRQAALSGAFSLDATARRKRRSVRFCDKPPLECLALQRSEYDRTPHPVVIRLTYRDVLELREMKVELGIVTKRQIAGSGNAATTILGQNQKRNESPTRSLSGDIFSSGSNAWEESPVAGSRDTDMDSSPTVTRASEFPSSSRLVSRLREMGEPQPPARESGMGISVEPTFGLDKVTNYDSPAPVGNSSRRLARKTSGDFAVEESEFQKELRKARAELEMISVQEARKDIKYRDKIQSHGLAIVSGPSTGPVRPLTLQQNAGLELERKPSLSIFSNSYPGVGFPNKNAASLYEPPSPTTLHGGTTPTARTFAPSIHSPSATTPRAIKPTPLSSGFLPSVSAVNAVVDPVSSEQEGDDNVEPVAQPYTISSEPVSILHETPVSSARSHPLPLQIKPGFRPPSPILAPFARSSTLSATQTSTNPADASPMNLTDPSSGSMKRPIGLRRESSEPRPIARSTASSTAPPRVLKPPSPILAPFARSLVPSVPSMVI
ncbi:hypothetical protein QFC22_005035 [Naganishia vaughanmartiniae]|uniref:Uncharacterized protein n=1 Tax=Naganishia vaughanmartiniae TaxID=1424756 RepID=A0ACC2WZE2_9TREE|nr:hypothetical protein QFC22_005035 [Naganishia vaughanmartiniae]